MLPTWLVPATPVRFTSTPCPSTIVTVPTVEVPATPVKVIEAFRVTTTVPTDVVP